MSSLAHNSVLHEADATSCDVCIVGAGAAGLMCAIEAGKRGRNVIVLEKAAKVGRKILISGGGRCNFTNLGIHPGAYLSQNEHFCKSALARYTQWDFMQLMEKHHLSWQEKTLGQLFCDQKAKAVVQALLDECSAHHITILTNKTITDIHKDNTFRIQTDQMTFLAESLVIATGGPSIPKMGATDFGIRIAKQFGLKTLPFRAGLVPLVFPQEQLDTFFNKLSGISLPVEVCCRQTCFRENMLFTHRGLSGPAILQISSYWQPGDTLSINLLPDLDIPNWLEEQQQKRPNTELKNLLAFVLPKRLARHLCNSFFTSRPMRQYPPAELKQIAWQLRHLELHPATTEGMRTAEVSLGGVDVSELSSKTFAARKVNGLYFIGETLDVTGHLGGYNFQWAWSSGWCAGHYV